jgi:hypothetical protein
VATMGQGQAQHGADRVVVFNEEDAGHDYQWMGLAESAACTAVPSE